MLSREELREIAKMQGNGTYFVSLYLNVNPVTNPKGEYVIWLKNALRDAMESLDKNVLKKVEKDLNAVEAHVAGNRRGFKKGLVLLSSSGNSFWRQYNLAVPLKNELVVDKSPYIQPLLDIFEHYPRYAVLFVDKEMARIFVIHLGEITEYGEVHTPDVPGKHKKGGWFALAQTHYERHIEYHVGLHLKDVIKKLECFFKKEDIDKLVIGGSEDAVSMTKDLLPKTVMDKIMGTFHTGMFENNVEVLKKVEQVISEFEMQKEKETVDELIRRAMKNDKAVLGMENVINAAQEGKMMRLVFERDLQSQGFRCDLCGALSVKGEINCPYCGGKMDDVNYLVDFLAQKAVEQGALVEVVSASEGLKKAGSIGAFLRF
jgi:peptide chain release factor subunit 1